MFKHIHVQRYGTASNSMINLHCSLLGTRMNTHLDNHSRIKLKKRCRANNFDALHVQSGRTLETVRVNTSLLDFIQRFIYETFSAPNCNCVVVSNNRILGMIRKNNLQGTIMEESQSTLASHRSKMQPLSV